MDANEQELAAARVNCKRGCPGPSLLEVARGGHNCEHAIWRAAFNTEGAGRLMILPDPELERARATVVTLEDQLARIEAHLRAWRDEGDSEPQLVAACDALLEIVTGADVERDEALAALAAEPVQS